MQSILISGAFHMQFIVISRPFHQKQPYSFLNHRSIFAAGNGALTLQIPVVA